MFVVSWSTFREGGNQSFNTRTEMDQFIANNHSKWRTYSRWTRTPSDRPWISELTPITD